MAGSDYIFGIRALMEAVASGKTVEKVFIKKGLTGDLSKELFDVLRANGITYQFVPIEKLNRITRGNHQGVIALSTSIVYQRVEDVIMNCFEAGKTPFIVVLDGVTDVRNFGAIARSAECSGVDAIVFPEKGSASPNSDAVKTSAGALMKIPVCKVRDLDKCVKYLKDSGLTVVAASEKGAVNYTEASLTSPLALVMGAEDTGVSEKILAMADAKISIPILGTIQSLNVSVAAGILMYEVVRQKSL